MTPPAPMPLSAFGSVWYGGLFGGLCRALVAPWLDPWWFVRATQRERLRAAARQAPGVRPAASRPAAAAQADVPAREATIIPFDRARARVLAARKPADHRR
jgi:hypothetical protein